MEVVAQLPNREFYLHFQYSKNKHNSMRIVK